MPALITAVAPKSPAGRAGVRPGDRLAAVNGQPIADVLDYKFYTYDAALTLSLLRDGAPLSLRVRKAEGDELGLSFETYLMDGQKRCANRCVFCFIDQLPQGMRPTLYFKDDDARLSFLSGNYITLTNLSQSDAERMIKMRISPLNISVHTTDPALRTLMLGNPRGGDSLRYLKMFAAAGLRLGVQIVLCPGLNDGPALDRTLGDLSALWPAVQSVAVVPVGLTRHRQGLYPLEPVGRDQARACIAQIDAARARFRAALGAPLCFAADEFYLKAGLPLPPAEYYGDFDQLENGVGLMALFEQELLAALGFEDPGQRPEPAGVVCGTAAAGFMARMIDTVAKKCDNWECSVFPVRNDFFGPAVDVSGLVTGGDIAAQLGGRTLPPRLFIPQSMLRHGETVFLDDMSLQALEAALGVRVEAVEVDGGAFIDAIFGR